MSNFSVIADTRRNIELLKNLYKDQEEIKAKTLAIQKEREATKPNVIKTAATVGGLGLAAGKLYNTVQETKLANTGLLQKTAPIKIGNDGKIDTIPKYVRKPFVSEGKGIIGGAQDAISTYTMPANERVILNPDYVTAVNEGRVVGVNTVFDDAESLNSININIEDNNWEEITNEMSGEATFNDSAVGKHFEKSVEVPGAGDTTPLTDYKSNLSYSETVDWRGQVDQKAVNIDINTYLPEDVVSGERVVTDKELEIANQQKFQAAEDSVYQEKIASGEIAPKTPSAGGFGETFKDTYTIPEGSGLMGAAQTGLSYYGTYAGLKRFSEEDDMIEKGHALVQAATPMLMNAGMWPIVLVNTIWDLFD